MQKILGQMEQEIKSATNKRLAKRRVPANKDVWEEKHTHKSGLALLLLTY